MLPAVKTSQLLIDSENAETYHFFRYRLFRERGQQWFWRHHHYRQIFLEFKSVSDPSDARMGLTSIAFLQTCSSTAFRRCSFPNSATWIAASFTLAIVAAFSFRHCFRSALASSLFLRAAIATRSASSASAFSRRSTSLSESESISIGTETGTGTAFEVLVVEDMIKQIIGGVLPLHCASAFLISHPWRLFSAFISDSA